VSENVFSLENKYRKSLLARATYVVFVLFLKSLHAYIMEMNALYVSSSLSYRVNTWQSFLIFRKLRSTTFLPLYRFLLYLHGSFRLLFGGTTGRIPLCFAFARQRHHSCRCHRRWLSQRAMDIKNHFRCHQEQVWYRTRTSQCPRLSTHTRSVAADARCQVA